MLYFGLVDARISASENDLPVLNDHQVSQVPNKQIWFTVNMCNIYAVHASDMWRLLERKFTSWN